MIEPAVTFQYPGPVPPKKSYRFTKKGEKGEEMRRLKARIKAYEAGIGWEARRKRAHKIEDRVRSRNPNAKVAVVIWAWNQRPDMDNLLGCILDGLKGVAFPDDAPKYVDYLRIEFKEDGGPPSVGVDLAWRI